MPDRFPLTMHAQATSDETSDLTHASAHSSLDRTGMQAMLKDGHQMFSGLDEAVLKNIDACKQLSLLTKTSMGPNGDRPALPAALTASTPRDSACDPAQAFIRCLAHVFNVSQAVRPRKHAAQRGCNAAVLLNLKPAPARAAGMNKMVINHLDKLFVTSDAHTIIDEMEVQHPAAKLVVFASQAQQQEIGDGTNFVRATLG